MKSTKGKFSEKSNEKVKNRRIKLDFPMFSEKENVIFYDFRQTFKGSN